MVLEWSQRKEFIYKTKKFSNTNILLGRNGTVKGLFLQSFNDIWSGVIYSKNQLTKNEFRELLLVRLNQESQQKLSKSLANLLVNTYRNSRNIPIYKKYDMVGRVPVLRGNVDYVALEVHRDIYLTLDRMQIDKYQKENLSVQLEYQAPLMAPLEKGMRVGYLILHYDGVRKVKVPVYVKDSIQKGSRWNQLLDAFHLTFR